MKRTAYIMIGIIGSGKSTWSRKMVETNPNVSIVSRDGIREMINGSYVFDLKLESLVNDINSSAMVDILLSGRDLIVDECHNTRKSRNQVISWIMANFNDDVKIVGVYCPSQTNNVDRRMQSPKGQSRELWESVYERMVNQFQVPTADEFDEFIVINEHLK